MTPTNKLRFVQRPNFEPDGPPFIRVLQQWWDAEGDEREDIVAAGGEWLDVPMEVATWCEIHQHHKWCEHNGGKMGPTGWEAP